MHKIDLNSDIRLDLISDTSFELKNKIINKQNIRIERCIVDSKFSKKIHKKEGVYTSIFFDDITDFDMKKSVIKYFSFELKKILREKDLLKKTVLIVGLGNNYSTPDSLGPKVIDNIITTRHISLISNLDKNYSIVSKIVPGVFANTGIETFDIIKGIVNQIKPDYLIVIDSLLSTSINKLNKVIQLTDSGIDPGSGVGNQRKEISKKTMGIDVIAIGVPTVVTLNTIVKDIMYEYNVEEILDSNNKNFLVTPKEIDFVINDLSQVISKAINITLHNMTK